MPTSVDSLAAWLLFAGLLACWVVTLFGYRLFLTFCCFVVWFLLLYRCSMMFNKVKYFFPFVFAVSQIVSLRLWNPQPLSPLRGMWIVKWLGIWFTFLVSRMNIFLLGQSHLRHLNIFNKFYMKSLTHSVHGARIRLNHARLGSRGVSHNATDMKEGAIYIEPFFYLRNYWSDS